MKIYLDSSSFEITELINKFDLAGATSNPSILYRNKTSYDEFVARIPSGKSFFIQLVNNEVEKMINEAKELIDKYPGVIIKVAVTKEGLEVINKLHKLNIKTLATAIYSYEQGIFAAYCGATYLAPYVKRMCNEGKDGIGIVKQIQETIDKHHLNTEIIAASFSDVNQVNELFLAGIEAVTLPLYLFEQYINNSNTYKAVADFEADAYKWKLEVNKK